MEARTFEAALEGLEFQLAGFACGQALAEQGARQEVELLRTAGRHGLLADALRDEQRANPRAEMLVLAFAQFVQLLAARTPLQQSQDKRIVVCDSQIVRTEVVSVLEYQDQQENAAKLIIHRLALPLVFVPMPGVKQRT
jgi:hypothetical protein